MHMRHEILADFFGSRMAAFESVDIVRLVSPQALRPGQELQRQPVHLVHFALQLSGVFRHVNY
jgi:hypothetical protein